MVIIIGFGIHPLSGAWEIELIERFRVCLQACSCYFLHDNPSRIAQSRIQLCPPTLADSPTGLVGEGGESEGCQGDALTPVTAPQDEIGFWGKVKVLEDLVLLC